MSDIVPLLRAPTPDDPSSVSYPGKPAGWTPPPTLPTAGGPAGTDAQRDGFAYMQAVLADYGLESLSGWAWEQIVAGNSPTMVMQMLRERPEYKKRFNVIFDRQAKGLSAISPAEVIAYERQGRALMRAAGMPEGFYDSTDDLDVFLGEDVSLSELSARIDEARDWVYRSDPTMRAETMRLYGYTEGDMVAHMLDPDAALPAIQRRINAARSGSASLRAGFGNLSVVEAERLADLGITAEQALQGFGALVESEQLFRALPGTVEDDIGREEQMNAAFGGDARAQQAIERQRRLRQAQFASGGSYVSGKEGFTGLGVAQ